MSADRQLANEIEFDLRKFEEQQEELERQRLEQLRRRSRGAPVRMLFLFIVLNVKTLSLVINSISLKLTDQFW